MINLSSSNLVLGAALVLLLALLIGAAAGYRAGAGHAAAKGAAALSECRAEHALAVSAAVTAALETQERQIAAGEKVERRAVKNAGRIDGIFNGLKGAAHDKNVIADRSCRLDPGGLRLWDAANAGAALDAAAAAADAGGAMSGAAGARR